MTTTKQTTNNNSNKQKTANNTSAESPLLVLLTNMIHRDVTDPPRCYFAAARCAWCCLCGRDAHDRDGHMAHEEDDLQIGEEIEVRTTRDWLRVMYAEEVEAAASCQFKQRG